MGRGLKCILEEKIASVFDREGRGGESLGTRWGDICEVAFRFVYRRSCKLRIPDEERFYYRGSFIATTLPKWRRLLRGSESLGWGIQTDFTFFFFFGLKGFRDWRRGRGECFVLIGVCPGLVPSRSQDSGRRRYRVCYFAST